MTETEGASEQVVWNRENRRQTERAPLLQTEIISISQQFSTAEYLGNSSCHPDPLPQIHYLSSAYNIEISPTAVAFEPLEHTVGQALACVGEQKSKAARNNMIGGTNVYLIHYVEWQIDSSKGDEKLIVVVV